MRRTRNPVYGYTVSRVRIPLLPPQTSPILSHAVSDFLFFIRKSRLPCLNRSHAISAGLKFLCGVFGGLVKLPQLFWWVIDMPKVAKQLSDLQVRSLKVDGVYAVGGVAGLSVRVQAQQKTFILRYSCNGRRREISIGHYPVIGLADARNKATEYRRLIADNIDPLDWKQEQKSKTEEERSKKFLEELTFGQLADRFIEALSADWQEKDKDLLIGRLGNHILPKIENSRSNSLTPNDIAEVLAPHWKEHHALATKLRQIMRQVFTWGKAKGYVTIENPVDPQVLKHLLPKYKKTKDSHHAMLPVREIPRFMADLHRRPSMSAKCMEFAVLTAVRSSNARLAEWSEIDFKRKLWVIPSNKMKVAMNGNHEVPLSEQAIQLLQSLSSLQIHTKYVFPSPIGLAPLSDMSLRSVIHEMHTESLLNGGHGYFDPNQVTRTGKPAISTPHGIARASFRTWAQDDELGNDRRFSDKIAELCLHHKVGDAYNGAYERNQAMKSRIEMMQAWGDYCLSEVDDNDD